MTKKPGTISLTGEVEEGYKLVHVLPAGPRSWSPAVVAYHRTVTGFHGGSEQRHESTR